MRVSDHAVYNVTVCLAIKLALARKLSQGSGV